MVNCCRRSSSADYREIIDTPQNHRLPKRANCCGAPFHRTTANSTWHLTALAVMGVCTGLFTTLLFNPAEPRDDHSAPFGLVTAALTVLSLASFITEGIYLKNRCTKARNFPGPLPLVTTAIICGCITWLVLEKRATKLIDQYNYTEEFIKQHLSELQKNCVDNINMYPETYTNPVCTVCDKDDSWFAYKHGPFQAWQDENVSATYCFQPQIKYPCLMTREWLHNIKMNYTYPGLKFLCGTSVTSLTTTTLNETQLDDNGCVRDFLGQYLGFYPPMVLKVQFLENNCVTFTGAATYRNIIEQRCYPNADRLVPYPLSMPCANSVYVLSFNELEKAVQIIRNYTLPYPQRAYDLADATDNYALSFAIYASVVATGTYELITCSHRRNRGMLIATES